MVEGSGNTIDCTIATNGIQYIIREIDVTERAFSTHNDKARMWMQMDTGMDLALRCPDDVYLQRPSTFFVHMIEKICFTDDATILS